MRSTKVELKARKKELDKLKIIVARLKQRSRHLGVLKVNRMHISQ